MKSAHSYYLFAVVFMQILLTLDCKRNKEHGNDHQGNEYDKCIFANSDLLQLDRKGGDFRQTYVSNRQLGLIAYQETRTHQPNKRYEFFLRCPKLPPNEPKITSAIMVQWMKDTEIKLLIKNGKIHYQDDDISKIETWISRKNRRSLIAHGKDNRYKFEYEEERGWFAFRVYKISADDLGRWYCRVRLRLENGTAMQYESRKTIYGDMVRKNTNCIKYQTMFENNKNENTHKDRPFEREVRSKEGDNIAFSFSNNPNQVEFTRTDIVREVTYMRKQSSHRNNEEKNVLTSGNSSLEKKNINNMLKLFIFIYLFDFVCNFQN